jgi:3,4-dihydroxy 2-butanone 4-phosphate synthase/GTP cyclohydrolase II
MTMRLEDYLQRRGMTNAEFAKIVQLSEATVSLLIRGEIWMSRATAQKILKATRGEVTPNDFLSVR